MAEPGVFEVADIPDPAYGEVHNLLTYALMRFMGWDDETASDEAEGLLDRLEAWHKKKEG